jgi:hypothetical protein
MHLIGYWASAYHDDDFCVPQEIVGHLSEEVRTRVADYLDSGELNDVFLGLSWCRFRCGISHEQIGSAELTDGLWGWPEGLSHYVREHEIILPSDFVNHALSSTPPRSKCDFLTDKNRSFKTAEEHLHWLEARPRLEATLHYWRQWCAAHRSLEIFETVRRLWRTPTPRPKLSAEQLEHMVAELIEKNALGNERCIFLGCDLPVLSGMKFCAIHSIRE